MLLFVYYYMLFDFFTFQSGYIQILSCYPLGLSLSTLHSNLVIFKWYTLRLDVWETYTLHSNLVIFKFKGGARFNIAVDNFTFQSGYIQIKIDCSVGFCGLTFTFQSGYIQMLWCC